MRPLLTLLLALSLAAAAGCVGKDEKPILDANSAAPGATTDPTAAPGLPDAEADADIPLPPAPREVHTDTHSFAAAPTPGVPDPADPTAALGGAPTIKAFTMPPSFTRLSVTVTFSPMAPLPVGVGQDVKVGLADAAGTPLGSACTANMPLEGAQECIIDASSFPGDHMLVFSGMGTIDASVSVIAS